MTDSPPLPQEPCPECEYLGEARVRIAATEPRPLRSDGDVVRDQRGEIVKDEP